MLSCIKSSGNTTLITLGYRHLQLLQMALVLLQKAQAGTNNLAGIIVTPLLNFHSDKILEISPQCYRCRFHIAIIFYKVTNIW